MRAAAASTIAVIVSIQEELKCDLTALMKKLSVMNDASDVAAKDLSLKLSLPLPSAADVGVSLFDEAAAAEADDNAIWAGRAR